ncbi:Exonuclease [uncultured virus]|nr:Exonuclease [uncultured virus]
MATSPGLKILLIGDPHVKYDNELEINLALSRLVALIIAENPDVVIVLGDILHKHEKIDMGPLHRASAFLLALQSVSRHLIVLIGNHDRRNNKVFQTDEHPFNMLKLWPRTTVVDKALVLDLINSEGKKYPFACVPYVEAGRFEEALTTADMKKPYKEVNAIFAHQEFKGSKMGAITSNDGDPWDLTHPDVWSGHIHDDQTLPTKEGNIHYIGTPIQHGYGDKTNKTVSFLYYVPVEGVEGRVRLDRRVRVSLGIPRKIEVTLTPEELAVYEHVPDTHVKIRVEGLATVIKQVMQLDHVIKLSKTHGVRIITVDTTPMNKLPLPSERGSTPVVKQGLQMRLHKAAHKQGPELLAVWNHLFGSVTLAVTPPRSRLKVVSGGIITGP